MQASFNEPAWDEVDAATVPAPIAVTVPAPTSQFFTKVSTDIDGSLDVSTFNSNNVTAEVSTSVKKIDDSERVDTPPVTSLSHSSSPNIVTTSSKELIGVKSASPSFTTSCEGLVNPSQLERYLQGSYCFVERQYPVVACNTYVSINFFTLHFTLNTH